MLSNFGVLSTSPVGALSVTSHVGVAKVIIYLVAHLLKSTNNNETLEYERCVCVPNKFN